MKQGEHIGRLVRTSSPPVYRRSKTGRTRKAKYEMYCDPDRGGCGTVRWLDAENVRKGRYQSCGCLLQEKQIYGGLSKLNGQHHPLYDCWRDMIRRCYDESRDGYKQYGARGIRVCDEWHYNYLVFYHWAVANQWQSGLEIDRKDVNGNYEPDNCRFITHQQNANNKTNSHWVAAFDEIRTVAEWSEDERCPVSQDTLKRRFQRNSFGGDVEKIITTPVGKEDD